MKKIYKKIRNLGIVALSSLELGLFASGCSNFDKRVDEYFSSVSIQSQMPSARDDSRGTNFAMNVKDEKNSLELPVGSNVSLWASHNYSNKTGETKDVNFGFNYSKRLNDKFSYSLVGDYGAYSRFGQDDVFTIEGKLKYNGYLDVEANASPLSGNADFTSGVKTLLRVSKDVPIYSERDFKLSIKPNLSSVGFFSRSGEFGVSYVSPGVALSLSGNGLKADVFAKKRFNKTSSSDDLINCGLNVNYEF